MRVHIGHDHAGFEMKQDLMKLLQEKGYEPVDHGPQTFDAEDDYPAFCIAAAEAVVEDQKQGVDALGVVLGGSGNGEQIAANKVPGVRAALAWNEDTAKLAREHNDANVISIGAREHSEQEAVDLILMFLAEPFSKESRHIRRIKQLAQYDGTTYPLNETEQS
ncbi:MAG: ribose-5-phosphate isomerase [Micrococcaceae bacterium]